MYKKRSLATDLQSQIATLLGVPTSAVHIDKIEYDGTYYYALVELYPSKGMTSTVEATKLTADINNQNNLQSAPLLVGTKATSVKKGVQVTNNGSDASTLSTALFSALFALFVFAF